MRASSFVVQYLHMHVDSRRASYVIAYRHHKIARRLLIYARISVTTRAGSTPVSRWSRPWNLYVNRIGSKPKQVQDRGVQVVDVDAVLR